jgi:FSR family fosmidomycin resistance protein-like MFS transporter
VEANGKLLKRIQVILLALIHGFQHIVVVSLPPLFPLIQGDFGLTYSQLGMLQSASRLSGGILQIPAGVIADRYGKKRILLYGFFLMVCCLLLAGFAPSFIFLLCFQFLLGVGDSVFHPSTYAMVSQGSQSQTLGKNISIHTLGGWIGTAVAFGVISYLGSHWGWRFALKTLGGFGFLFLALIFSLVPEVGGSAPKGKEMAGSISNLITRPIVAIFFIAAFGGIVRYGLMYFLPTFLGEVYGFSVADAGIYSTIYLLAGAISTILGGWLADKLDRLRLVIFESVATIVAVVVLSIEGSSSALLPVSLFASGILIYIAVPAFNALLSFYSSDQNQGWIYGVNFSGSAIGSLVGALLIGFLADMAGFRIAFLSLALFSLLRTVTLLLLKRFSATMDGSTWGMEIS